MWALRVVQPVVRVIETHESAFGGEPSVSYQRMDRPLARSGYVMPTVRRSLSSFLRAFEPVQAQRSEGEKT